ncbi:carbamate kinase [Peptoniphilus koenoeneniae]|uniref:Carbamate kinase n=1 Tax=Peptoniphilus koenoeneniae TaxID=507751 RepID=A0ABU0ATD6_9FIRM|nr:MULTISPECIES: carbamate kinase [Peptoniphilus]ERT59127.1 carbamate kinase [Peptoniphilus sp. BV3C26]MDQ0274524.1 carbamate kinase [Peptoniphilus koenoeneniae]
MGKRIVLALGGNALGNTPEEQKEAVKITAESIVDLIEAGNEVVIGHGNGPQVGMINLAMTAASESAAKTPAMPFPECGAMSQGYIGYHLQNAIENELAKRKVDKSVVTLVTQVLVDEKDPAFSNPTKPIGSFYSKEEADKIVAEKGYTFKEDAGRGYRRVVASPKPVDIVEKASINAILKANQVVIAGGGGGIPVIKKDGQLEGVAAVIDKDFTSAKLAELVDADMLVILTAVEKVAIRFGKPDQEWLNELTIADAHKYIEAGEFAPGSMLPKVEAALSFVNSKKGNKALITSLESAKDGIAGKTGTTIVNN